MSEHRKQLDALAQALLSRETLNELEILEVTGLPPAPALETGMLPVPGTAGGAPVPPVRTRRRESLRSGLPVANFCTPEFESKNRSARVYGG